MNKKAVMLCALTLYWPLGAHAQDSTPAPAMRSVDDINPEDYPNRTIVILDEEETGIPGYVHERYAYVDRDCPGRAEFVDYYGAPIDPKDPALIDFEQRLCADIQFDGMEGD